MFQKRIVTMVDNEVVYSNAITLPESMEYEIGKLVAVYSSNPTTMMTDDMDVIVGSIWDGEKFIYPKDQV